jgi:superfamily I DNA/RNA helicase
MGEARVAEEMKGKVGDSAATGNKYDTAKAERAKHVQSIVVSQSRKKVVVAGPGTGKTYLFKEILYGKKDSLTLTFVNALVEDLSLDLIGVSDVRTLHGFAGSLLRRLTKQEIFIFPALAEVIQDDAAILRGKDVNFSRMFHERDDENENLKFYAKRKEYYANCFGHSDVIFAAVRFLERNRDKIPLFDQILVDEFQDFNRLEVSLIDLLSESSPVLLAGDDDQALYDFKSASPTHIRERYNDKTWGYEPFYLPFCSRCTRVIVEAANEVIAAGTNNHLLRGRIVKPYMYFEEERKDVVSNNNPKIAYSQPYAKQIPWFIAKQIEEIAKSLKSAFDVLVISPTRNQSREIAAALRAKGFGKIEHTDRRGSKAPTLIDGLKLLMDDDKSNLGWRIVCGSLLTHEEFAPLLRETDEDDSKAFHSLARADCKARVKKMVGVLKMLRGDKPIDQSHLKILEESGLDLYEIMKETLAEKLDLREQASGVPGIRKTPIKLTTIQSSKGLSAEYVFITHCDDQYLIRGQKTGVSDQDICSFLVALTRARRKVFLLSSRKEKPTFVKWISEGRIEHI